jgi:hypothetical protein|nr:MAG TPA: hypothetical protein [Caudoviricetes sp.]
MKKIKRPPLGIMPKDIYYLNADKKRLSDLQDAIARYYNADLPINLEWIKEYNELITKINL